jgi:hypothetical protein
MASQDRRRADEIRDLIEELDRVRRESERVRDHADRAMKNLFWPDRRREPRFPTPDEPHHDHHSGV